MSEDKGVVEIVEPVVEEAKEVEVDLSELGSAERKMAEAQGIVKKEETKVEDKQKEATQEATTKDGKTQTFEDTEKNESQLVKNFNSNEKALYWKWKHDKKERQEAQAERDLAIVREKALKNELEKIRSDHSLSNDKLGKINKILTGPADEITVEAIQAILGESKKDDKDKPLTAKDLEDIKLKERAELEEKNREEQRLASRVKDAEDFGKTKFGEDYENIMAMAQEVIEGKVEVPSIINIKDLSVKLIEAMKNKDVELDTLSDYVVGIAKLNPKFGKPKEETKDSVKKETNENIDRILKNASKQQTSASVGGGGGRRVVSYDDLTPEDVAKMSTEQWRKLPEEVRKRLLS